MAQPNPGPSNDTTVTRAGDQLLHRLIEAQVARTPHAPAVECDGRVLSYAALDACANRLAATLVANGTGADTVVGVLMERSLELMVALLAIHKAGGAFLPVDPALPRERVRFKLADTQCAVLLVHAHLDARAAEVFEDLPVVRLTVDARAAMAGSDVPVVVPTAPARPEHLAYILYTSGSTGRAKGVMVPHRAIANHAQWFGQAIDLTPADRVLQYASISFDAAMAELFAPLVHGATVVMAPPGAQRDLASIPSLLQSLRITVAQAVPSALHVIAQAPDFAACTWLRYLVSGGESLDGALAATVRRALPAVRLGNFYGPTEATVDSTWVEVTGQVDETRAVPIGRPIANVTCHVLDERGAPVAAGDVGELHIGGIGLARGYLNLPDRTAARFVPDPSDPAARLYRTGDLARWRSDGLLEYLGRTDSQVKLRGYRIELAEVEAPLLADRRVRQAAVVLRTLATGEEALVAYAVPVTAGTLTPRMVRDLLRRALPAWMVPSSICMLDTLPLTVNGKLDRDALPEPPAVEDDADGGTEPPPLDDPLERSLQGIWERTLGIRPIGRDDDFFALGGHSITALRLLAAVEATHGVALRTSSFFAAPTIRAQAARIREPATGQGSTVIAVQARGAAVPIFIAPGGGGEMLVLDGLARTLGPAQPLHVLDLHAFGAAPHAATLTLPQVAMRLIADMQRVQPTGPYRLVGYSLGGNIVYEMAQQLRAAGAEVAELVLLDCDGPGYPVMLPAPVRAWHHLRHAAAMGPAAMLEYLALRAGNVARGLVGAGRAERALFGEATAADEVPTDAIAGVERALAPVVNAWLRYTPRPYAGPVLLVRAAIRRAMVGVVDTDPMLGWGPLLCGPVRVEPMACDHWAMLRPEHAPRLAALITSAAPPA